MTSSANAGIVRALAVTLAVCFLGPAFAVTSDPVSQFALVGVRTGERYVPIETVGSDICSSCASVVPAHEWLWLRAPLSVHGQILRVSYREDICSCRAIDLRAGAADALIPAADENVTAIVVELLAGPTPESGAAFRATFIVQGAMPPDARAIAVEPEGGWIHSRLTATAGGIGAIYYFTSPPPSDAGASGSMFLDMSISDPGSTLSIGGYSAGNAPSGLRAVVDSSPPTVDATASLPLSTGQVRGFGTTVQDLAGWAADVRYGYVGPREARGWIVFFSLDGIWEEQELGRGDLARSTESVSGARLRAGPLVAEAGTLSGALHVEEGPALVIATVAGGAAGNGEARITHETREARGPITNFASPLSFASSGECSGDWVASLEGWSTAPLRGNTASVLAALNYTPSLRFQQLFHTNNGWCG